MKSVEAGQEPIRFRIRDGPGRAGEVGSAERRKRIRYRVGDGGEGGNGAGFAAAFDAERVWSCSGCR